MANYSIALGVQPPQIDATRAFAAAAQQRQARVSEENAIANRQIAQARLGLAEDQFGMQKRMHEARLGQVEGQQNALAEYNRTNDIKSLNAYPGMQGQVLGVREKMQATERAAYDQQILRNARRAQRVAGMQGDARVQAWQEELAAARDAGDITPDAYERYAAVPPNELLLNSLIEQAIPIEKLYAAGQPTSTQRNVDAVIANPAKYPEGSDTRSAMLGNKGPTVQVVTGDHAQLGKTAHGKVESDAFKSQEQLARLNDVQRGFKEEYLQLPHRAGMTIANWREKLGRDLAPGEEKALYDYAAFRSDSVGNLNKLLNELSGAAVSPQEYTRIASSQPNAGTGLWDGDGPTQFKAKLDTNIKSLTRAIARQHYVLKQGLSGKPWEHMGLDEVDGLINKRGAEILGEMKAANPEADEKDLRTEVKLRLRQEFGIGFGGAQ